MKEKKKEGYQPILVYLCGVESSEIKPILLQSLSNTYFLQGNQQRSSKCYMDNCYAITSSSVFVFVMDKHSIQDQHCLSLLGVAVSFHIPVISVRQIGYSLPYKLPKMYKTTEIVDRSKSNEYGLQNQQLPAVTTLENVLKALFVQSVVFHEQITAKCIAEIKDAMGGLSKATVVQSRSLLGVCDDDDDDGGEINNDDNNPQGTHHTVRIKEWPDSNELKKTKTKTQLSKSVVKTTTKTTTKGDHTSNNNRLPTKGDHASNNYRLPTKGDHASNNYRLPTKGDHASNNYKLPNVNLNGSFSSKNNAKNNVKNKAIGKCKISIYTAQPNGSRNSNSPSRAVRAIRINNVELCSEDLGQTLSEKKDRISINNLELFSGDDHGRTVLGKKERSATTGEMQPRHDISRRRSSLPCITTNYLVSSDRNEKAEPQIYHFPMSPRLHVKRQSSNRSSINKLTEDDDDHLALSAVCSPIDFRSDEETNN